MRTSIGGKESTVKFYGSINLNLRFSVHKDFFLFEALQGSAQKRNALFLVKHHHSSVIISTVLVTQFVAKIVKIDSISTNFRKLFFEEYEFWVGNSLFQQGNLTAVRIFTKLDRGSEIRNNVGQ